MELRAASGPVRSRRGMGTPSEASSRAPSAPLASRCSASPGRGERRPSSLRRTGGPVQGTGLDAEPLRRTGGGHADGFRMTALDIGGHGGGTGCPAPSGVSRPPGLRSTRHVSRPRPRRDPGRGCDPLGGWGGAWRWGVVVLRRGEGGDSRHRELSCWLTTAERQRRGRGAAPFPPHGSVCG